MDRLTHRLLFFFLTVIFLGSGIIFSTKANRAATETDFISEARQAATVDAAVNALDRGFPWLEEHFANTVDLRIWQSNLNYLKQQPSNALLSPQIQESIRSNANSIKLSWAAGGWWAFIAIESFLLAVCSFLSLLTW